MRKITLGAIFLFNCLLILAIAIAFFITRFIYLHLPLGDFTGVVYTLIFIILFYLSSILEYRLFLKFFPLEPGEIEEGSREEFTFNTYLLFYLILFNSIIKSKFIPITLMRTVSMMLGAKLGENTYSAGTILDPPFTIIGSNTVLGENSVVYSHIIEGKKFAIALISIGSNVTVGANAVIMPGVTIEDDAIVAAGAVVKKGTKIKSREVWGGIPAKKIKTLSLS